MNDIRHVAERSASDEYIDYMLYKSLSESLLTPRKLKPSLKGMAEQEYRHYKFWSKYADVKPSISSIKISAYKLLALIMGITFVIKMLERHEKNVIANYKQIMDMLDDNGKEELAMIIMDEEKHEDMLMENLPEERRKYLGFTVLGLSDALIEIAGIHAGTLGVYTDTFKAGLAGLIAGVAASIAMASAAYNQAKQTEGIGKPAMAATYTGIAYILTALLLALPYFIIHDMIEALIVSLLISIGILAYISLYSHILYNRNFFRELGETTAIIFGATIALYVFGGLVGEYLGVVP